MTDIVRKDVMQRLESGDYSCAKQFTLAMISGKWKMIILWHLNHDGAYRFNDFRRLMPTVTHKVLASQLRELAEDQLVTRTEVQAKPLKVVYEITPLGTSLVPIIDLMCDWGEKRINQLKVTTHFSLDENVAKAMNEQAAEKTA